MTAIRYAWGENPCCPSVNRDVMPCPPLGTVHRHNGGVPSRSKLHCSNTSTTRVSRRTIVHFHLPLQPASWSKNTCIVSVCCVFVGDAQARRTPAPSKHTTPRCPPCPSGPPSRRASATGSPHSSEPAPARRRSSQAEHRQSRERQCYNIQSIRRATRRRRVQRVAPRAVVSSGAAR